LRNRDIVYYSVFTLLKTKAVSKKFQFVEMTMNDYNTTLFSSIGSKIRMNKFIGIDY